MPRERTALVVSTQHWHSPFRIGSHHIATEFARRGWRVAFLSAALSPLHLLPGVGAMKQQRWRSWRSGGSIDPATGVWHYVPFSLLPTAYVPGLRHPWLVRNAWRLACPPIASVLRKAGFGNLDVAISDHFFHAQYFPRLRPRYSIYRAADISTDYPGGGDMLASLEAGFARSVDLVVATSSVVQQHLKRAYDVQAMLVPNGVASAQFATPQPRPAEYGALRGPIAVYAGAMDAWFDASLVRLCAERRADVQFVLIGPPSKDAAELARLPNVHVLGPRPHGVLSAYLQHADVGMVPFRAAGSERFIAGINPLKAYEYLASGLRVVSTPLQSLPTSPGIHVGVGDAGFLGALDDALAAPALGTDAFDPAWDWRSRLAPLIERIDAALLGTAATSPEPPTS